MTITNSTGFHQIDRIGGEQIPPSGQLDGWLCEPGSGERIAQQATTDLAGVDRAIAIADEIDRSGTWMGLPVETRALLLERVAEELDTRSEEIALAESTGSGVVISVARLFAGGLAGSFRGAAAQLRSGWLRTDLNEDGREVELLRLPWGPTVILVPWNAPAAMAAIKVANALAVGAPVILKPPEWAPFGCNVLADAIDAAGLPAGVFQMVHGGPSVGVALTTDPRIRAISFTGSVATGRAIAHAAAENFKAVQLELGGNNPVIIRPDADIDRTAASVADGMVKLNGQWCEGPGKIFVRPEMLEGFVDALERHLSTYRIGSNLDPNAQFGPLSHESHRQQLEDQIQRLVDRGAHVRTVECDQDLTGWIWPPRIVLGVDPNDCVDELFGPVVTVHAIDSDEEAIQLANESPYGLAGYVFGQDIQAAMAVGRAIRFGEVKINGTSLLDMSPASAQSFWRNSGIGGHGDKEAFAFFCGTQIVGVDRQGLPI